MIASSPIVLGASPQNFIELTNIERFDDGSGFRSLLNVGSGRFSCTAHPFYFDDLSGFTEAISKAYDKLEGKAWLGDIHETDFIEFEVLKRGHVSVTGLVVQHGEAHQELRFAFGCDQTFLPDLLRSIKQVVGELNQKS